MNVGMKAQIVFGQTGIGLVRDYSICIELNPSNCWYSAEEVKNEFRKQFPDLEIRTWFSDDWDKERRNEGVEMYAEYLNKILGATSIKSEEVKIANWYDSESGVATWNQKLGIFQGEDGEFLFWDRKFDRRITKQIPLEILSWFPEEKPFSIVVKEGRIYNISTKEWYVDNKGHGFIWEKAPIFEELRPLTSYTFKVNHPWD